MECFFVKHALILSQSTLNITSAPCREWDQTGFLRESYTFEYTQWQCVEPFGSRLLDQNHVFNTWTLHLSDQGNSNLRKDC